MDKKIEIRHIFVGALVALAFLLTNMPTQAAPNPQYTAFPTPTPGPDGRIIYIVQSGDTLWRVSAVSGVPIDEIRRLNNLGENDVIQPGQELLLGLGGPSGQEPTPVPQISPTPSEPTPTAEIGVGTLCIILYDDANGDAIRQEEEPSVPGGAISISSRDGSVSITEDTVGGSEHQCFENLKEGDYNITVAIPEGYNATTILNYPITLNAGDETYLDFGAQKNSETLAEEATLPAESGKKSPVMGIVGGILMLLGLGLGVYAWVVRK